MWHFKELSLLNGHECCVYVKICSPSPVMVTSLYNSILVKNSCVGPKKSNKQININKVLSDCHWKDRRRNENNMPIINFKIFNLWKKRHYFLNKKFVHIMCTLYMKSQLKNIFLWTVMQEFPIKFWFKKNFISFILNLHLEFVRMMSCVLQVLADKLVDDSMLNDFQ